MYYYVSYYIVINLSLLFSRVLPHAATSLGPHADFFMYLHIEDASTKSLAPALHDFIMSFTTNCKVWGIHLNLSMWWFTIMSSTSSKSSYFTPISDSQATKSTKESVSSICLGWFLGYFAEVPVFCFMKLWIVLVQAMPLFPFFIRAWILSGWLS